jgi:hypothetical protein
MNRITMKMNHVGEGMRRKMMMILISAGTTLMKMRSKDSIIETLWKRKKMGLRYRHLILIRIVIR